ncbi:uncharacterized protein LOC134859826 [Eleginops maclovinus]|uniref:uncharacterized protein LOC134859826 n=1 Tax=Eleginops maclovinus TaxID=56733 RepID=UPI00308097B3
MIGGLAALIFLSALSLIQTAEDPQQILLTVVELGSDLSLACSISSNEAGLFNWYKLKYGYMVQKIAAGTLAHITLQGEFNNSRFAVTKLNAKFVLKIRNVSKEDEATYFCQAGSIYYKENLNGTLLVVNDHKNLKKSFFVSQSPETESVHPGDSVTLQCSLLSKNKEKPDQCPGEHHVYWFRSGSEVSHSGVIYTPSEKQKERSCAYSLFKTIQNSSDTGTYYCAVATCGQILLGEGTTVETRQKYMDIYVPVLGTMLACCLIVIAVLIISRNQKPVGESSSLAVNDRLAKDEQIDVDIQTAMNYAALKVSGVKVNRKGNDTVPYVAPVLPTTTSDRALPSRTYCGLSVR